MGVKLLKTASYLAIVLMIVLALTSFYLIRSYQRIDLDRQLEQPSLLLDRNGEEISRFAIEYRQVVTLEQISPYLIDAVIAVEDSRFYQHFGLDPRGIARALWRNLQGRRVIEGGSTITQQLAKNEYFIGQQGAARTLDRKIREALYAVKLERTYTKGEILERYLNRIYFGHGRFGVEAASQYYFGKSARDLTLSEAALLAGIPRGPALYSPRINLERALERRNVVLASMEAVGVITAQQRIQAASETPDIAEPPQPPARANHFRLRVEEEARKILAATYPALEDKEITNLLYQHGLRIHTTLDLQMQAAAETVIVKRGKELLERNPYVQGVLVAIDPQTGGILALVESIDLSGDYPRATLPYMLGSSFKGLLYAAALQNGFTASTTVTCEEIFIPEHDGSLYSPSDFGGTYHNRPLRVREALEESCNVVAVKVGQQLGLGKYLELVERLNPRLAIRNIGSKEHASLPLNPYASPLDLALAHAPLINGGYSVTHHTITEIRDKDDNILYRAWPERQWVLDERIGYIVTDMLTGVRAAGGLPFATAGKTGTDQRFNLVFVGFTSEVVATTFFGFDNPSLSSNIGNAARDAAPAWREFISLAYQDRSPPPPFNRPPNIEEAVVCTDSGALATPACPQHYTELYLPGTGPVVQCPIHGGNQIEICTTTYLPANPWCPAQLRVLIPRPPWMRIDIQCWYHQPTGEGAQPPGEEGDEDNEEDDSTDENGQTGGR